MYWVPESRKGKRDVCVHLSFPPPAIPASSSDVSHSGATVGQQVPKMNCMNTGCAYAPLRLPFLWAALANDNENRDSSCLKRKFKTIHCLGPKPIFLNFYISEAESTLYFLDVGGSLPAARSPSRQCPHCVGPPVRHCATPACSDSGRACPDTRVHSQPTRPSHCD